MPKPRRLFFLTLTFISLVLLANLPNTFTTTSQKTKVTITIHPNEDTDNNDDQDEDSTQSPSQFNFFSWLKSIFN